ncbi:MAG: serine/threonine protein kinase [Burkholderiales bacterium]|nr:serine/threonine protein kinase [Burkholderiales bacterium]
MTGPAMFGRYELIAELGKGAMGVVYKANDPMLSRTVAIKTINMDEAEQDGLAEFEARLYQEAKAAGGLNHANIVIVHDIGKSGNLVYMAMEYVEGGDLRDLLTGAVPLETAKALDIAAQIAEGLAYAHEHHVVHRDIKPANIMITPQGRVKITDFGIARMRLAESRTQAGVILGSPKYLSPEQVTGQRADHRADIFSLGVILYQMLTGHTPFNGDSLGALMYQTTNLDPPAPSTVNAQVPVILDYIVAKALAKAPESRYQGAAELAKDLRECSRRVAADAQASTDMFSGALPAAATTPPVEKTIPLGVRPADAGIATVPVSTRGVSRAFDSQEATQRLMREVGALEAQAVPSPASAAITIPTPVPLRALVKQGEHPWGQRENTIFAATVAVALAIAAAIVLA